MKTSKKYLLLVAILAVVTVASIYYVAEAGSNIDSFPESYQSYLEELQKKYPNWNFVPLNTNLDWNTVIDAENKFGKNLVPKSYSDAWKNTTPGEYNVEVDAGWVDCSRRAIEYTMDPRNFLNEVRIFQFEGLSYEENTNSLEGIEKILYGTEFYNRIVEYKTTAGNTVTMSSKYSDLIAAAGKESQVSNYHLASRIKQEVGPFLSHSSISGIVPGFEGYYNFYNIGATSSAEPMGAIKNGLQYAKDGKGASNETKTKYRIPWNTKEKAITGGGIFIGSSYIHLGQDTIYLQKFHVYDKKGGELFWHQYMTNVLAPYSESKLIYNGYVNTGILNSHLTFLIPVYNNMPAIPVSSPNIKEDDFTEDNTKVYADVTSKLNIRTGPSTSYELLTTVDRNVVMTRIAKGKQAGELWDKVQLPNGMIGYAFQSYLKEVPEKQIEKITVSLEDGSNTIAKGETKKLNVTILPEEAKTHEVKYISSDSSVATVDSSGNVLGIQSGEVTITVKAKENSVSGTIKLKVYTKVTGITVATKEIYVTEGSNYLLQASVLPEDADNKGITYLSQNPEIATIDEKGQLTAVKQGTTKIILTTQDQAKTAEVTVTVVAPLKPEEVIFDNSLLVEKNIITGWDITQMKVENIKQKITTPYTIKVYHANGTELKDTEQAGTGSVIQLLGENGETKMEYQIVIYGDVGGDGKINSFDLLVLQKHILEIEELQGAFRIAGNTSKNGKNPSSFDSLQIQKHILEIQQIEQRKETL